MNVEIRPCIQSDFSGTFELLKQLWPDRNLDAGRLHQIFDKKLATNQFVHLIAESDGQILGYGSFSIKLNLWASGKIAYIDELVVDENSRNLGIGKKLIEELKKSALQKNCAHLELDSSHHRQLAHRFYEKLGFENRALLFSMDLQH